MQEASWWLLDEATAHLDPGVQLELLESVRARRKAGGGVIMVTHDLAMIPSLFGERTRIVGLSRGEVHVDQPLQAETSVAAIGALMSLQLVEVTVSGRPHWVVQGSVS